MLILTRRSGEGISIGAEVEITVLEVSGDHVRLGIAAPKEVLVLRKELREEVERENRLAASAPRPHILPMPLSYSVSRLRRAGEEP